MGLLAAGVRATADDEPSEESDAQRMWQEILHPSPDTVTDLDRGEIVTWFLSPGTGRVLSFVALAKTTASALRFADVLEDVAELKSYRTEIKAAGLAGQEPGWASDALYEDDEVLATQTCRPGRCDMKVPANVMAELRNTRSLSDTRTVLERFLRECLADYRRGGASALPHVNDKTEELVPGQAFRRMLDVAPLIDLPQLQTFFLRYPDAPPTGAREQFVWTRERFLRRDVTSLTHCVLATLQVDGRELTVHAAMQLNANHYFDGVQLVTGLLHAPNGDGLLFVWHRVQIDLTRRPLNAIERWFLSRRGRGRLEREVGLLRGRIEQTRSARD